MHLLADFFVQTDWQAKNKKENSVALLRHTIPYSILMGLSTLLFLPFDMAIAFTLITFVLHTATDALTSREVGKHFKDNNYHDGFGVIGIDQFLHYTQLILTFILLK